MSRFTITLLAILAIPHIHAIDIGVLIQNLKTPLSTNKTPVHAADILLSSTSKKKTKRPPDWKTLSKPFEPNGRDIIAALDRRRVIIPDDTFLLANCTEFPMKFQFGKGGIISDIPPYDHILVPMTTLPENHYVRITAIQQLDGKWKTAYRAKWVLQHGYRAIFLLRASNKSKGLEKIRIIIANSLSE